MPLHKPDDRARYETRREGGIGMEILIVSGFLGSGKTSLIVPLAKDLIATAGRRIAIIENDYGRVSADAKLINSSGLAVKEICAGCICCSLGPSLLKTLQELESSVGPDLIIIEPSGLANPDSIISTLRMHQPSVARISTIVLLDSSRFAAMMPAFDIPLRNQVAAADLLVVNKIDKTDARALGQVQQWLSSNFPHKAFLFSSRADRASLDEIRKRAWT